jgi:YHS domain-containing protein
VQIDRGEYVEVIQRTADEVAAAKAEAEKKKPINEKCPISGKPASPDFVVVHEGKTIGFCCEKCVAKFEADPAEGAKKVPELDKKP